MDTADSGHTSQCLQVDLSAEISRCFAFLLRAVPLTLHKSDFSPDIVVFHLVFLAICYVSITSPPCNLILPQALSLRELL